jgi:hypothetical protein
MTLSIDPNDPLYVQKQQFLYNLKKPESETFPLRIDRYPIEMVEFARFLLLTPEELGPRRVGALEFGLPLSEAHEDLVLSTLIDVCTRRAASYPTTMQQDEMLLQDRAGLALLSRKQRMALKLRVSEKKILNRTVEQLKKELGKPTAERESGVASKRKDPVASMSKSINELVEDRSKTKLAKEDASRISPQVESVLERRRRRRKE